MKKTTSFSMYIGTAYITLAIVALMTDYPENVVNGISLGALMFSVSEIIMACSSVKSHQKSFKKILENDQCRNKSEIALECVRDIYRELLDSYRIQKSKTHVCSMILKILAFMSIIVWPYTGVIQLWAKIRNFGTFCTIMSFGIMFLSVYYYDQNEEEKRVCQEMEIFDYMHIVIKELSDMADDLGGLDCENNSCTKTISDKETIGEGRVNEVGI